MHVFHILPKPNPQFHLPNPVITVSPAKPISHYKFVIELSHSLVATHKHSTDLPMSLDL